MGDFSKLVKIIDMKRFVLVLAAAMSAVTAFSQSSFDGSDSRVTYVGRTLVKGADVSFDWSATYVRISFEGNSLAVRASDSHKDYFNVWIDREMSADADKILTIESRDTLLVLASAQDFGKKAPKTHTVIIQKRTEGEQGTVTFHGFEARNLLQAEPLKERLIEFVGDSYTCGYGSENSVSTDHFSPATESSSKTYAAILARYFGADYMTISHSGQGIDRNYDDNGRGWHMPDRYLTTFDCSKEHRWTPAAKPAMTMIYLGTNDFSTSRQPTREAFVTAYIRLIKSIKDNYGKDHPVLCVSSKTDAIMFEYVREAAERCGFENVWYDGLFPGVHHDNDSELGADWHPNYQAHIKIAHALAPYISTLTGWDMELKPMQ